MCDVVMDGAARERGTVAQGGIFYLEYVFVPIIVGGNHWVLVVVDLRAQRLAYYDSMRSDSWDDPTQQRLTNVFRWLFLERERHHQDATEYFATWQPHVWVASGMPQQRNAFDCGVFMCQTANYIAQNGQLNFSQQNMPAFRLRMACEIGRARLF